MNLELAEFAKEQDILLVADEVQIGNGRSGELYGYMNFGITPDIVSTAKGLAGGLPIGATLLGVKVKDVYTPGLHGSTFGGNPVCAAGALSVLERLTDEFLDEVNKIVRSYTLEELNAQGGVEKMNKEMLKRLQNIFGADYIVGISFPDFKTE